MKRTALLFQLLASMVLAFAGCGGAATLDDLDAGVGAISQANMVDPFCGGVPCPCGKMCDHQSNTCSLDYNRCGNGMKDVLSCNETDVDCGGSCTQCANGKTCLVANDCLGGFCINGKCADVCGNGVLDPDEADTDCGAGPNGPGAVACAVCADGKACFRDADCNSGFCDESITVTVGGRTMQQHVCRSNPCTNGMVDPYWESGRDCGNGIDANGNPRPLRAAGGGACPKCADTKPCLNDVDCNSGFCDEGLPTVTLPERGTPQHVCNSNPCTIGTPSTYWMSDTNKRCGAGNNNGQPRPLRAAGGGACPLCPDSKGDYGQPISGAYMPDPFDGKWSLCRLNSDCASGVCNMAVASMPSQAIGVPQGSGVCMHKLTNFNADRNCDPERGETFQNHADCKCMVNNQCDIQSGETWRTCPNEPCAKSPPDMVMVADMAVPPDMTRLPDLYVPPDLTGADMANNSYVINDGQCELGKGENAANSCHDCGNDFCANAQLVCEKRPGLPNSGKCVIPPDGSCRANARCMLACIAHSACRDTRALCAMNFNNNVISPFEAPYALAECVRNNFANTDQAHVPICRKNALMAEADTCNSGLNAFLDYKSKMDDAILSNLVTCDLELTNCP